jgi:Xaa-Pro aminopeptidase
MAEAIQRIQALLKKRRIQAILITNIYNVRYLTGFTGSSGFCLITKDRAIFFTDFRYTEQAEQEVEGWELATEKGKRIDTLKKALRAMDISVLGFETTVSYEFFDLLQGLKIRAVACKDIVESLRISKSEKEIHHIREAFRIAESAFMDIKGYIKAGVRELDIALRLESALRKRGSQRAPFDIIVASGPNGSRPHATVTLRKIRAGDFVIIDWGAQYRGYCADITRTLLIRGNFTEKQMEIYNTVNEARKRAIMAVKIGTKAKEVDAAARQYITQKGYGEHFGHGTGHGIGLQAHEAPWINRLGHVRLSEGMTFTIEPGIYLRNTGGVRIEDTVAIVNGKGEVLNSLPTALEIVG